MCGIVGCVGKIWKAEEDAFKLLLQLDTIRGPHSTGVLSVGTTKENWDFLKCAGTPWELFDCTGWQTLMRRTHRVLLGHNRWATMGEITNDNAHPFAHGDFVGVHNGTLRAQWRLKNHKQFEVDSSNIYFNMNEEGIEETLKKLEGAFALVWYNANDGLLQIVRNKERPLWICRAEDGKTYFWASEPWMLRVALGKQGIKHNDPIEIEDGKLVSFEVPGTDLSDEKMKGFIPHIKDVEFHKPIVYEDDWRTNWKNYDHSTNYASRKTDGEVTRNNVVPFVKQSVGSKHLKEYSGKVVHFSVIGERKSHNMEYILCQVEDDLAPDVRVFASNKTKLGRLLLSSSMEFKGKVKGFTAKEQFGNYLTLDHRSIEEVELDTSEVQEQLRLMDQRNEAANGLDEEQDKEVMLPANNGKMLSLQNWYRVTERGCSWCSDFPRPEQAAELTWFSEDEYLCPTCSKDAEVIKYLK